MCKNKNGRYKTRICGILKLQKFMYGEPHAPIRTATEAENPAIRRHKSVKSMLIRHVGVINSRSHTITG